MTDSLAYLKLNEEQKGLAMEVNKTGCHVARPIGAESKTGYKFKGKVLAQQVIAVMKQRNAALTNILTTDQQKLFVQHQLEQLADLQTKMMTTQLDLTEQQIPQVYQINLKQTGEMLEDLNNVQDSKRKMQKARAAKSLKSDSADKDKALKKVLSQQQYEKYEQNKEAQQAAMKEKMEEKKR